MKKVAYHGSPHWAAILVEGLKPSNADGECLHIWLAREPGDAAVFGTVLEVDMTGIEGDFPDGAEGWQAAYHGGSLGPERISLYLEQPDRLQ